MTSRERMLIRSALYYAARWHDELAASWGKGTPERRKAASMSKRYMRLREKFCGIEK